MLGVVPALCGVVGFFGSWRENITRADVNTDLVHDFLAAKPTVLPRLDLWTGDMACHNQKWAWEVT